MRALEDFVKNGGGLAGVSGQPHRFRVVQRALYKDGKGVLPYGVRRARGRLAGELRPRSASSRSISITRLSIFSMTRAMAPFGAAIKLWYG